MLFFAFSEVIFDSHIYLKIQFFTLTAGLSEKEPVHEGGRGCQVVSAFMQVLQGLLATEHKRSCEDRPCATQAFLLA